LVGHLAVVGKLDREQPFVGAEQVAHLAAELRGQVLGVRGCD
jgi:hypothetical protein